MAPPRSMTPSARKAQFVGLRDLMEKEGRIEKRHLRWTARVNKFSREEAINATFSVLDGVECDLDIVDMAAYRRSHGKYKSKSYDGYEAFCKQKTYSPFGWLVFRYVRTSECKVQQSVRVFNADSGTSNLHKHSKTHVVTRPMDQLIKVPRASKQRVIDAAVLSVVHDLRPFSFLHNSRGMTELAKALFTLGQTYPPTARIDFNVLLPSGTAVHDDVVRRAADLRSKVKENDLPEFMDVGGAVSMDGLKQSVSGKKFYDVVLHYVSVGPPHPLTGSRDVSLRCQVLLLREHDGQETAAGIKCTINNGLMERFNIRFTEVMSKSCLVTDWANTLPCIVGRSASPSKVPFDEKWLGCMSHRLNTVMKHVIDHEIREQTTVSADLTLVKSIVRIEKQSGWNRHLPEGLALYAECDTRFGTTHDMINSFLKSQAEVEKLIDTHGSAPVKLAFESLTRRPSVAGFESFPALAAIVDVFGLIRTMQTVAETNNTQTLYMMLPMLKNVERQLRSLSYGFIPSSNVAVPSDQAISLSETTLKEVKKIPLHDLYVSACILHPGMRDLQRVVGDKTERATLLSKGTQLIKRVMSYCSVPEKQKDKGPEDPAPASNVQNDGRFVLNDFVVFHSRDAVDSNHAFARYMVFDLTDKMQDQLKHYMGFCSYGSIKRVLSLFLVLLRCAFWLFRRLQLQASGISAL